MDLARSCLIARSQVSALLETWVRVPGSRTTPPVLRAALWHPTQYCLMVALATALAVCAGGVCVRPRVARRNVPRTIPAVNHLEIVFPGIRPLGIIQRPHDGSEAVWTSCIQEPTTGLHITYRPVRLSSPKRPCARRQPRIELTPDTLMTTRFVAG